MVIPAEIRRSLANEMPESPGALYYSYEIPAGKERWNGSHISKLDFGLVIIFNSTGDTLMKRSGFANTSLKGNNFPGNPVSQEVRPTLTQIMLKAARTAGLNQLPYQL